MAYLRKINRLGERYVAPAPIETTLPARKCDNWRTFGVRVTCSAHYAEQGRSNIAPPVHKGAQFSTTPVRKRGN